MPRWNLPYYADVHRRPGSSYGIERRFYTDSSVQYEDAGTCVLIGVSQLQTVGCTRLSGLPYGGCSHVTISCAAPQSRMCECCSMRSAVTGILLQNQTAAAATMQAAKRCVHGWRRLPPGLPSAGHDGQLGRLT
jgi:hypothetical protein